MNFWALYALDPSIYNQNSCSADSVASCFYIFLHMVTNHFHFLCIYNYEDT